ncbi:acyl carrier protein [Streptomyces diastatochromogenes]|nr:acyl carrier protein [Streptomyces diastatochromogenes]
MGARDPLRPPLGRHRPRRGRGERPRGEVLAEFHGIHLFRLAGGETATATAADPAADRAPLGLVQWSARRLADMARLPLQALSRAVERLPAPAATPAPAPAPAAAAVAAPVPVPAPAPGSGAADLVAEQFLEEAAQVLGMARERLDLRRTLHDYGMDSLTATQLRARTRRRTNRDVPLNRLLGEDSLGTLATAVTNTLPLRD